MKAREKKALARHLKSVKGLVRNSKGFQRIADRRFLHQLNHIEEVISLVNRGALFVVNHSGGKDSQAMFSLLASIVPRKQLMVIHAHLGEAEWRGVQDHVKANIANVDYREALAYDRDGNDKTFFDMVLNRGMWPSPMQRQCTSDLKRGPIEREIRRYLKENPQFDGLIVNCMGLRAQESSRRAKATTFAYSKRNSKAGREWYDWLPIHDVTIDEDVHLAGDVYEIIEATGQKPHWAYLKGMKRLSCCFCIMACQEDLRTSAKLNTDLYAKYVAIEKHINHTFSMPVGGKRRFLEDTTGIKADKRLVEKELARLEVLAEAA